KRAELLEREKELTRLEDELAAQRRELPWLAVEKDYTLQTEQGPRTLAQLFEGRSQLAVYHFMSSPDYAAGCPTNSSIADAIDRLIPHLNARDVTMMCVSRAPIDQLMAYRKRMGWSFPWASSHESDFSLDFGGSTSIRDTQAWLAKSGDQLPPIAVHNAAACGVDVATYISEGFAFVSFALDGDTVYQTYSAGRRGVEFLMPYYAILDRVPSGRHEGAEFQTWLRRRDEYGND
ncbi:MAG: DUF899 domain-containing protein, partial [Solirubrobacteraceae bacterium]